MRSSYIHSGSVADANSWLYSISAVDSAGNFSPRIPGLHSTVFVSSNYDSCNNRIRVNWNKYIGWENNVSGYRLFGSYDNQPYTLINGLSASDSLYDYYNIEENTHYSFFVEAVKNDGLVSRSNINHKYTYMPGVPEDMTALNTNVLSKSLLKLNFSVTDTSSISRYALLRSGDPAADFIQLAATGHSGSGNITFEDEMVTSREIFYYKLAALNTCNHVIKTSNLAVNILLTGSVQGKTVELSWNPYIDFNQGVEEYAIMLRLAGEEDQERGRAGSGSHSFTDNINDLEWREISGEISYYLRAVERNTGITSTSNELTLLINSEVFIPNAFTPNDDGLNDIFLPVFSIIPQEYTLIIYDRQGLRVFASKNSDNGWDGTINGIKAAEGVYMYFIEYKTFGGKRIRLNGNLTLFYPF
jgi:gliding motility-associated-like protein